MTTSHRGAAATLAMLVTAACVSCAGDPGDADPPAAVAPSDGLGASTDPTATEVIELPSAPVGIAAVDGRPWTAHPQSGTVRMGDGSEVEVGADPLRLASTPDGVWVSVFGDGRIVRIDPRSGAIDRRVKLAPAGSEPEGLAWDGEQLWVVDQAHDRVVALDADGTVVESFPTDSGPRLAAAGPHGVWVTSFGGSALTRVRDGQAETAQLEDCSGPQGVAEAAGRVWVACTLSSTVVAVDADTLEPVASLRDVTDPDVVVSHADTVYVVGQSGPVVYVIDPATATVRSTTELDDALAAGSDLDAAIVGSALMVTYPDRIYTPSLSSLEPATPE